MLTRVSDAKMVLVMAGAETEARQIASTLVEERLAACVNIIGPVNSIYRWRGAIENATEYLLMIKTRSDLYGKLEQRVRELHSYEVPEIIALAIDAGEINYLNWINESTEPGTVSRKGRR